MKLLPVILLGCLTVSTSAFAAPTPVTEAEFSEAVIAFQQGEFRSTVNLTEELLAREPQHRGALELRGLALRERGYLKESLKVFQTLREVGIGLGLPASEQAPYDFQTATLLVEMKRWEEARLLFLNSLRADFNPSASKYYLGVIALAQMQDAEAQSHFRFVVRTDSELLRASALYYLGVLAKRRDDYKQANYDWREAKRLAENIATSRNVSDASATAARGLASRAESALVTQSADEHSAFFGSVAVVTQYDSNPILNPLVVAGTTGAPTLVQAGRVGLGYEFRLESSTITPTYSGSFNYIFNPDSKGGQFQINDVGITFLSGANSPEQYGIRTGVTYVLRDNSAVTTGGSLTGQSIGIPVAPFARFTWAKSQWTNELSVTPQQFFTDPDLEGYLAKTGFDWRFRTRLQYTSGGRLFNPGIRIETFLQQTNGDEFKGRGLELTVSNQFIMSGRASLLLNATAGYAEYPSRPTAARYDTLLGGSLAYNYRIWETLHFVLEASFYENLSNITDVYRYRRWVAGAGVEYRI